MLRRIDRRLSVIYLGSVGLIVIVSVFNLFSFRSIQANEERAALAVYPLQQAVDQLMLAAANEKSGVRGYVISGNSSFLYSYEQAKAEARRYAEELKRAESADSRYEALVPPAMERLKELEALFEEQIRLTESGNREVAEKRLSEADRRMHAFQDRLSGIDRAATDSLKEERIGRYSRSTALLAAAVAASVVSAALAGLMSRATKRALRSRQESERRYRWLVDGSPDAIAVHQGGRIVLVNPACAGLMGASHASELVGQPIMKFVPKEYAEIVAKRAKSALSGKELGAMDEKFIRVDGKEIDVEVTAIGIPYEGRPAVLFVARETGLRKEAERKVKEASGLLNRLSTLDGLTGVPNRSSFETDSKQRWEEASETLRPLSLLLIDVDGFKSYNEIYGPQAGDACLQTIASVVEAKARKASGAAYRYGGETFAVLLPDLGPEQARKVAGDIQEAVRQCAIPHEGQPDEAIVTIGIGIASRSLESSNDKGQWSRAADHALELAKKRGRDSIASAEAV